jgi:uncharacterized protein YcbK (DUF882 family)
MQTCNVWGPYFTDSELGIDNNTFDKVRENLYTLVKFGLNPIRAKFGPTKITSGYRTAEANTLLAFKGYSPAPDSQHITGEAVDIMCTALPPGQTMRDVFEWLKPWWPGQCFFYAIKGHVHIALPRMDLQMKGRLYALVLDK